MTTRYDHDNLPTGDWAEYRKLATTSMIALTGPFTVATKEGTLTLPVEWEGFIAIDVDGYPYPIAADVHAKSYLLAEGPDS